MGYWGEVASRAAREAAKDLKLDNAVHIMVGIAAQAAIGVILFAVVGLANASLWVRAASALAPFATFPVAFLIRMTTVPPAMNAELGDRLVEKSVADMRHSYLQRLSGMYVQSGEAGNNPAWDLTYGFAWPPEEWLNERLAEYGENWSVMITGARYQVVEGP